MTDRIAVILDEITNDPLALGYAGKSDREVADLLNTGGKATRIKAEMSGDDVFQQTDPAEFSSLADTKKQLWLAFCARDFLSPSNSANVAFVKFIFGDLSVSQGNFITARLESISRGENLGLGFVGEGDVWDARNN